MVPSVDQGCCVTEIVGVGDANGGGGGAALKAFQVDSSASILTSSNVFVVLATLAGDAKVLTGATWKANYGCDSCPNHDPVTDLETLWEIETSTGVFAEFDRWSIEYGITPAAPQKSIPLHLQKLLVPAMDAPRMRVSVRKTQLGPSTVLWEFPRWGGVLITEAP